MRKLFYLFLLLVQFSLLAGCAGKQVLPRFVWPPPPEEPRVEWKGVYYSEDDFAKEGGGNVLQTVLGNTSAGSFKTPIGIVSDGKGKVYVSDVHWKNVWVYDFGLKKVKLLSNLGNFVSPLGLAIDKQGNLYVADGEKGSILVFDKDQTPLYAIEKKDELLKPAYLAVNDELGRLYVADGKGHRIVVFTLTGEYLFSFGSQGGAEGQFFSPQGLAFSPDGRLFVADMFNARIQVFNADGSFNSMFGSRGDQVGQFESPKDVAFDSAGHLYVVEARRSNVEIFQPDGTLLLVLGDGRATANQFGFSAPRSIFIDENDQILVSEALGRRFAVWQYFGDAYRKAHPFTAEDKRRLLEYVESRKFAE